MELREQIIKTLEEVDGYRGLEHERQADAILALPGIKIPLMYAPRGSGHFSIVTKEGGRAWVPGDSDTRPKDGDAKQGSTRE